MNSAKNKLVKMVNIIIPLDKLKKLRTKIKKLRKENEALKKENDELQKFV